MTDLLTVENLTVDFETGDGTVRALDNVEIRVGPGEAVAIVGESGSGKSTLAYAILQYLAQNGRKVAGTVRLEGRDLSRLTRPELHMLRGAEMSVVSQDPATSFNPTLSVGRQVEEAIRVHTRLSGTALRVRALEFLRKVGLPDAETMMDKYPHQLSGGEKQRALIAAAIATGPKLLIMDEPTTALDVTTAAALVALLKDLKRSLGVAILYITHDLGIMAQIADRAYVMKQGAVVEEGTVEQIVTAPRHPYTQRLLASVPDPEAADGAEHRSAAGGDTPLLEVRDLKVSYPMRVKSGPFHWGASRLVQAVHNINLKVGRGETVGLIGESGSGKSTIARALVGLNAFNGEIALEGNFRHGREALDAAYRRDVQMIFQHPDLSLNPRIRIAELIGRPLKLQGGVSRTEINAKVAEIMRLVQLSPDLLNRFTYQLSGGQKQRVAIARAFITRPKLVICDEITSGLDVTVQKSIMELLGSLQSQFGTSYLFITHDINLIRSVANRIYTMYFGEIVEGRILENPSLPAPYHPYTEVLVKSALPPRRALTGSIETIKGELPSRLSPPRGCVFASRCPRRIGPVCDQTAPDLLPRGEQIGIRCLIETAELRRLPTL
jgi:peptide/nickel transport system ATP-binding protein